MKNSFKHLYDSFFYVKCNDAFYIHSKVSQSFSPVHLLCILVAVLVFSFFSSSICKTFPRLSLFSIFIVHSVTFIEKPLGEKEFSWCDDPNYLIKRWGKWDTNYTKKIQVLSIQGQNSSSLIRIINGVGKFPTLELN